MQAWKTEIKTNMMIMIKSVEFLACSEILKLIFLLFLTTQLTMMHNYCPLIPCSYPPSVPPNIMLSFPYACPPKT